MSRNDRNEANCDAVRQAPLRDRRRVLDVSVPGIPTPDGVASKDFSPDEELSTELANRRQKLFALVMVGISAAIFLAAAPFAKTPLAQVPAFIPVYESALVICDVITAILLFGQFNFQRSGRL